MRRALGWEFVCVTTAVGTAGLEALSGSPGRGRRGPGAARRCPGRCPGLCPAPAAAGPGRGEPRGTGGLREMLERSWAQEGWSTNSQKLLRTRVLLCAACQGTRGTLFFPCSPDFKRHGLFLLYLSTLFCAENTTTRLWLPGKLRGAAAPGADSLSPSLPAHPHHVLPSGASPTH